MIQKLKLCSSCKEIKPAIDFYTRNNGKNLRTKCIKCLNKHEYSRKEDIQTSSYIACRQRSSKNRLKLLRFERANEIKREKYILLETRKQDKKKFKIVNDLDREFILNLIKDGCSYCKRQQSECKMTLDRIDNAKGHMKNNVIASCTNCK